MSDPVLPPPDWRPSVAQVQALVPTRGGGEFSSDPDPADVALIIEQVASEVVGETGGFDPAAIVNTAEFAAGGPPVTVGDLALRASAVGAALDVERGWFPEQSDSALVDDLRGRYLAALARLRQAIADSGSAAGAGQRGFGTIRVAGSGYMDPLIDVTP